MLLPVTSPSPQVPPAPSNMMLPPPKRNKRWRRVIRRVVPTFLTRSSYSEETRSRYDSSFKPTGETSVRHAIGGSSTPPQQNLITLEDAAIAGQCQGSGLSWTHDRTQLLRCPPRSAPDDLERASQRFVRVCSETHSAPQPPPQAKSDDIKQTPTLPLRLLLVQSRSCSITRSGAHCQRPVSDDPPSKGTDVSAIDPSPSPLGNGTHVANTFVAEFVPIIRSFIHSQPSLAVARNLRGEEAQELIDIIDQATAVPELDEELRKQCLHLLYKMSKDCKLLPTSYTLPQGSLSVGDVHRCGGFADVSTGDYLGRRVAVKCLRFWAKGGPDGVYKRFCREIIVWKRLSHPNILPLLGVSFSTDPYSFRMVSPWMQNGNVMEYTKSNPSANRLQLLSGVASGVSYLHGLGVIHGDLKGVNILADEDGNSLLADFGLATVSVSLNTVPLSATVVSSAGTIPWMSPELLSESCSPTRESDSYALGMVIYEVLTGRSPFHHLRGYTALIAIQEGKRPSKPMNARSLGFSDKLWELVSRCWDESPSTRLTAQDLLRCLQDISPAWAPPLEYPIPDGPDGEAGPDFISCSEQIVAMDASTSGFFVPLVIALCAFVLSFR